MTEKTCGNCACWNQANELLGACTGDILKTGRLRDKREAAADCRFWRPRWPEKHLVMTKVVATDFGETCRDPFDVRIYCTDGHVYQAGNDRIMQARCAGWTQDYHQYTENGNVYTENVWQGRGLPVIVTDQQLVR